jgi:ubiquinone/menaquinone biosynthesis C-methylase UbiE
MQNSRDGWEALADWYDKKQGDTGDLWHRALIDPVLVSLVGEVTGKDVLDLGCGNGYLSRRFARQGGRLTAVDSSGAMVQNAKRRDPDNELRINFLNVSANDLSPLEDESFDIVFANMTLMDFEDAEGAIKEVGRVLRAKGRFVASLSHPCFDNGRNSAWIMEKILTENWLETRLYRRIRQYRKLASEKFPWRISETERGWTTGYHRPLGWYARVFKSVGLAITALEEPEPSPEFLEKESEAQWFLETPLHIVIEAIKV